MLSIRSKVKNFAELVKFEHTIFALPFAYIGAILARKAFPTWSQFFWITLAMVCARSAAMGLNRVIDRTIDAANPRTAHRHLPRGLMSVSEVMVFVITTCLIFTYTVYVLSPANLVNVPVIIFILTFYSYTKRFTWLSHLLLGVAIGIAPVGGWVAVTQKLEPEALLLGCLVALWIAGFDVIYATQDLDFDRTYGLYSMPLNLGLASALLWSKAFHAGSVIILGILVFWLNLGWWFAIGSIITGLLLYYEHSLISATDLSKLDVAFLNVNGIISIQLLFFTVLDILF